MNIVSVFIYLHLCLIYILSERCVQCATLNDTKTLLSDLLSGYDINVRPIANQSMVVNVSVQPYIKSIQQFDEVQGKFSFVGALVITWHDVNMMWDPGQYGGVYEVTVLYPHVWIPEMILSSPSEDVDSIGKKWNKIRFYYNSYAVWVPVDLIESTCFINVRNYPFDTQECVTSFNTVGYNEYEVQLIAATAEFDVSLYQENSVWIIQKSKINVTEVGGGSQINLILFLNRKASFVIISVILPILCLSLLNVLAFLLVPESGERVSYCITVLLSIAVFMTIVSDMLPRSSDPVPIISYKLMIDMVISSLIVMVTIVNLRWYHKDDKIPVPGWMKVVYGIIACPYFIHRKVDPVNEFEKEEKLFKPSKKTKVQTIAVSELDPIEKKISRLVDEEMDEKPVTWRMLSVMVDRMALIGFTALSIGSFGLFIAITAVSAQ